MTGFSQTFLIPLFFLLFFDRYQASVFDNLNTSHNLAFSLIVAILSILFIYFVFSILFDLIVKKKKLNSICSDGGYLHKLHSLHIYHTKGGT